MIRAVSLFLSLLIFLCAEAVQEFDHTSSFNQAMGQKYKELASLKDSVVVEHFLQCCENRDLVDHAILDELNNIVGNAAGRRTLLVVTARLLPYVECANSLETLLQAIPQNEEKDENDKLRKAELVCLFLKTMRVTGSSSVSQALKKVIDSLSGLKSDPVLFPMPGSVTKGICDEVFSGYNERCANPIDRINKSWNANVASAVLAVLPILREGMFSLIRGSATEYCYARKNACAQICLSSTKPAIIARCITGPLLCNELGGVYIPTCYRMTDKGISAASGLHHEIFHHLVIGLEMDESPYFHDLVPLLLAEGVDGLYVSKLKKIYTDMDEFRNIIGLFPKNGMLLFDPCSEAAYLCEAGVHVRGTHKSKAGEIKYVPISFVNLLIKLIRGFQIEGRLEQYSLKRLKWC